MSPKGKLLPVGFQAKLLYKIISVLLNTIINATDKVEAEAL
jgi:hypothetical protein